ncbi:MAG TPA: hypothetical protein VF808_03600 [Ktedonobacterales bacterium]
MSDPGQAPEPRAGHNGQPGQQTWGQAPIEATATPPSALQETQPRVGAPASNPAPPRGEMDPWASGMHDTDKRKRVTDSARMPALRLNRRSRGPRTTESRPQMVYDTQRAPGYLGLARLVVGLALLVAAWGASLLVIYLAQALWSAAPHQPLLTERLLLSLLGAVGILWLAVIALGLIAVGAFSLFLALRRRRW